jgi:hypothetical protein
MEPKTKQEKNEPSSEELFIKYFLEENDFKFESEVLIEDLKGDDKAYRRADFYLTNYKVYLEYFGNYNSTKERRAEYDKKAVIYIRNNKPTVFLYPHELGILDYAFHIKLLKVLSIKKFALEKQLFRYKLKRYFNKEGYTHIMLVIIPTVISIGIIKLNTGFHIDFKIFIILLCFISFIIGWIFITISVIKYFNKNK